MYAIIDKQDNSVSLYAIEVVVNKEDFIKMELTEAQIEEINTLGAKKLLYNNGVFEEGATPEELAEVQVASIKERYADYKTKGQEQYDSLRGTIVKDVLSATITEEQAFIIEDYLSVGYDKLVQGDWKTAKFKLAGLVIVQGDEFVQPYFDEATNAIEDFIVNNY